MSVGDRVVRGELVRYRERRAPVAATQSLQWVSPGLPQVQRWNGRQAVDKAYLANFVVAQCCETIARDISGLPVMAGPRRPTSPTEVPETRPRSPLGQLLARPAPHWPWARLIRWLIIQRIVTGRQACEVEFSAAPGSSPVAALWPLVSAELRMFESEGGTEPFTRFEYGRQDRPKRLSPDQVWLGMTPAPDNTRQPYSLLQSAAIDVSVAVMVGRYNYAFLRNDARPAAVVVTEEFATAEDAEAFQSRFEGRHRGPDNAGKVAFVETDPEGATPDQAIRIETLGISQKDARMLEMHRASLEHVAMALGVPWSRLDASGRTFDNAEAEDLWYWESTIVPLVRELEGDLDDLATRVGGNEVGWFDLSNVRALQPRPPVDAAGAATLVAGGIASAEEVRPWFGLSGPGPELPEAPALPAGGGDVETERNGGAGHGAADPGGRAGGAAGDPSFAGGDDPRGQSTGVPGTAGAGLPTRRAGPADPDTGHDRSGGDRDRQEDRGLTVEEQETRRTLIWKRNDAAVRSLEATWARQWRQYFARQAATVVAQVRGRKMAARLTAAATARELRADLGGVFDPKEIAKWRRQAAEVAEAMHEAAATAGITRVNHAMGVSFDLAQPWVRDFVERRANQLAGQVTDTTYRAITDALSEGVSLGESVPDLAARVTHVFDVADTSRATTIARTEVISASNASASLAAAQLPADVVGGQEWIATRDGRTREDHAAADGQVVAVGQPFDVGGEQVAYPGDPAGSDMINCRCTEAFLTPDEFAEATRSRMVPLTVARLVLRTVRSGDEFDARQFRRALMEVAA